MHYDIRFSSRARRVSIRIEPPDQVIVVAPKRTSAKLIEQLIDKQSFWIETQLNKLKQKQHVIESEATICLFGTIYQKKVICDTSFPLGILIKDKTIILNFIDQDTRKLKQLIKSELDMFVKKTARVYLQKKTKLLATKMSVSYQKLTLRNQKTRWGSCSSQDNLNLNWKLVHYPPEIIDYVIIHELSHLTHHNHSHQFWSCVAHYDPDYKQHRNYLKKYAVTTS